MPDHPPRGPVRLRPQRRPLPDGRRLPRRTTPATASSSAPPARPRPTTSTPRSSRPWPRSASTCAPPAPTPRSSRRPRCEASDVVITMGCGDACPFFPGKRYEDWVLDDPAGQGVDAVRPIRDEIDRRVQALHRRPARRPHRRLRRPVMTETAARRPPARPAAPGPRRPPPTSQPQFAGHLRPRDHRTVRARLARPARSRRPRSPRSCPCSPRSSPRSACARSPASTATTPSTTPGVLFLCVHNAGRSQMAAGWLRHLAGDRVDVWSGGSEPGVGDQPAAVAGDGRGRHRHHRRVPQAVDRRGRPGRRRGHHHGLRRRLPALPRQALRGLGARRPRRARPSRRVRPSATRSAPGSRRSWRRSASTRSRPDGRAPARAPSAPGRAARGSSRYQAHLPRFSRSRSPASTSRAGGARRSAATARPARPGRTRTPRRLRRPRPSTAAAAGPGRPAP